MRVRSSVMTRNDACPLVRVASYARLSLNLSGSFEKTNTQHDDNHVVAEHKGWQVVEDITDDNLSAWNPRVRRPGWERLMAMMESGEIDGVVVWHVDRLIRRPRDLERLLSLAETRRLHLASAHGQRKLDDPDDVFILRIEVAHGCRSSDDTSRRMKRRIKALREDGVVSGGGPRRFGYPGKNRKTGEPVPEAQVRAEAELIVEAYDDVLAGRSLGAIRRDWDALYPTPSAGGTWATTLVRDVLLRPRNAGLVVHQGKVVARNADVALVDEGTYNKVVAVLSSRMPGRPRSVGQYFAGGLVHCGRCGSRMGGRTYGGSGGKYPAQSNYFCVGSNGGCGKVSGDLKRIDAELVDFIAARLSDSRLALEWSRQQSAQDDALSQARTELATLNDALTDLETKRRRKQVALSVYAAQTVELAAGIEQAESVIAGLEAAAVAAPVALTSTGELDADSLASADKATKRTLLGVALQDGRHELVPVINPVGKGNVRRQRVTFIHKDKLAAYLKSNAA